MSSSHYRHVPSYSAWEILKVDCLNEQVLNLLSAYCDSGIEHMLSLLLKTILQNFTVKVTDPNHIPSKLPFLPLPIYCIYTSFILVLLIFS
jgi:hypothetical protein